MFYMFMDHMFYIPMNIFNIMISMINYIIYVIIVMLIHGIKMILKLPLILTRGWYMRPERHQFYFHQIGRLVELEYEQ